jgi:hypothetical protein
MSDGPWPAIAALGTVAAAIAAWVALADRPGPRPDDTTESYQVSGSSKATRETEQRTPPEQTSEQPLSNSVMVTGSSVTVTPSSSPTADPYMAQVLGYLDNLQAQSAGFGHAGVNDIITGLAPGQAQAFEIQLEPSRIYRLVGACDNDCHDVDITVTDHFGGVIAQDANNDDTPVVEFQAPNQPILVHVAMANCMHAPCVTGVRTLTRY